jgi:hypothetical protein
VDHIIIFSINFTTKEIKKKKSNQHYKFIYIKQTPANKNSTIKVTHTAGKMFAKTFDGTASRVTVSAVTAHEPASLFQVSVLKSRQRQFSLHCCNDQSVTSPNYINNIHIKTRTCTRNKLQIANCRLQSDAIYPLCVALVSLSPLPFPTNQQIGVSESFS